MDKLLPRQFEDPLAPIELARVSWLRPLIWLGRGMSDLHENAGASLPFGLFFALAGHLILELAAGYPAIFAAATSGFLLVGPLVAAGFYVISRHLEHSHRCTLGDALRGLAVHADTLLYYGIVVTVVLISWERVTTSLFSAFYGTEAPSAANFFRLTLRAGHYPDFILTYLALTLAAAGILFSLSVVSLPMMMDRGTHIVGAMAASLRAVRRNPGAMLLWAALIAALTAIGLATYMVGLCITLPMVGHATWHAYRDLVKDTQA